MVKNLVFDVGRVLIDYNHENLLKPLGISVEEMEKICDCIFRTDVWQQEFDRGMISLWDATEKLVKKSPQYEEAIRFALSRPEEMPVPRPEVRKRIELLRDLGYKTYYLSNYSTYFFDHHSRQTGILEYMDGGVLSAKVHFVKPEREIFEIFLEKYNLVPNQCLFFDDRPENVKTAEKIGMETFFVSNEGDLLHKLDYLVQISQYKIV